jgi:hypothetical protein
MDIALGAPTQVHDSAAAVAVSAEVQEQGAVPSSRDQSRVVQNLVAGGARPGQHDRG